MNIWDQILPVNMPVVLWGGGEFGRKWINFLKSIGRKILFIIDVKANSIGSIGEIIVKLPEKCTRDDVVLIVTPHFHSEEICAEAERLGYKRILNGNDLLWLRLLPENNRISWTFPPYGHYYSLYPDFKLLETGYDGIKNMSESSLEGDSIDINEKKQCETLKKMNALYDSMPDWPDISSKEKSVYRYKKGNSAIGMSDGFVLHSMLRILHPKHFIEIGSGYSSMVTLDTNEFFLDNAMEVFFIEPYPDLFLSMLKDTDDYKRSLKASRLQDVPLEFFDLLGSGDILYVDSTHVSKIGSDVNYIFFHILPRLKANVYVHFHDIFYPWQYPKAWFYSGNIWNEMYILRAFLQYNTRWEVVFYNHYMSIKHPELYHEKWRQEKDLGGGAFWMRKVCCDK